MREAPAAREEDAPGTQRSTLDWLVRVAAPLLGLVGAALYGVLRLSYMFFYQPLRTTPEEVGYGYVEILATQLIGAIELVVIVSALVLVPFVLTRIALAIARSLRAPRGSSVGIAPTRKQLLADARRAAVVAVLLVLVGLPWIAQIAGVLAADGKTIRNVYPRGLITLPVLAVQAVPARVSWLEPNHSFPVEERYCLMYLGAHDGTAVFYDIHSEESVRLPTSSVTVVLQNLLELPDYCDDAASGRP